MENIATYLLVILLFFFTSSCKEQESYPKEIVDQKLEKLFDSAKWNVYFNCYKYRYLDSLHNPCKCWVKDLKYVDYNDKSDTLEFNFIIPLESDTFPTFYTIGIINQNIILYLIVGDGMKINNYTYFDYIKNTAKYPWVSPEFADTLKKYPLYFQTDSPYFINILKSSKNDLCDWVYRKAAEKGYF